MEILNRKLYDLKKEIAPVRLVEMEAAGELFSIEEDKHGKKIAYSHFNTAFFAGKSYQKLPFGKYAPKMTTRILFPEGFSLDEAFFMQAIESGYNWIIAGNSEIAKIAKSFNLNVLQKSSFNEDLPFTPSYKENLHQSLAKTKWEEADAFFWQSAIIKSDHRQHLLKHAKLRHELFLEELACLESFGQVFYCIEGKEPLFRRHKAPNTVLVLPNDIIDLTNIPHFSTKTAPIVRLSEPWIKGSFLDCYLQSHGKSLFGLSTFEEAVVDWLFACRPEFTSQDRLLLCYLKDLDSFLSMPPLTSDELKIHVEKVAADIKLIEYFISKRRGPLFSEISTYLADLKSRPLSLQTADALNH